jgi:hypothetical protein
VNLFIFGALVLGLYFATAGSSFAATSQDIEDIENDGVVVVAEIPLTAEEEAFLDQAALSKPRAAYCELLKDWIWARATAGHWKKVDQLQNRYIAMCN